MAPIERRERKYSYENTKQSENTTTQGSKTRTHNRTGYVCVPTITTRQNPINYRQHVIEYCTLTLNHACNCENLNCRVEHCASMKRVWKHVVTCTKRLENCLVCKNFQTLASYHTRQCQSTSCNVVFCSAIKKRRPSRSQLLATKCKRDHSRI